MSALFGMEIDVDTKAKSSADIQNGAIENDSSIGYNSGEGKTIKFSEMSSEEALKIAEDYRIKAPIEIPKGAKVTPKSMNAGYEQISYMWKDETYKYEVRWHTRTPGAPPSQGNTWVIERTTPGIGGMGPKSEILVGNQWISRYQWQKAIEAYQNGIATQQQLQILEQGHWKE